LFETQLSTIDTPGELQIGEAGGLVIAISHQPERHSVGLLLTVERTGDNPVGHTEQELPTRRQGPTIQDLKSLDVHYPISLSRRAQSELAFQHDPLPAAIIHMLNQQGSCNLAWIIENPSIQEPDRSGDVVMTHFTGTCALDA
jgi:hypothetical protein